MSEPDPLQPVVLASVPTEFEAHAIVRALEAVDVRATVFGGNLAGMRAEAPSQASVMVRRMDLDRAKGALKDLRAESVDFDPDELAAAAEAAGAEPDPTATCLACGYDVRHLMRADTVTCPECGAPRTRAAVELGVGVGVPQLAHHSSEVPGKIALTTGVILVVILIVLGFAIGFVAIW